MIKMEHKLIDWQCKCGAVYALEPQVPTKLHATHKERAVCQKTVKVGDKEKTCGNPFPNQESRDNLYQIQYGILEE